MKKLLLILFLISFSMLLTSCKDKNKNIANAVVIQKMYATSTDFGWNSNKVQNIFESGSWNSMPAKSFNEGVMLYFADKKTIDKEGIALQGASFDALQVDCSLKNVQIFINGVEKYISCGKQFKLNETFSKMVSSLFIQGKSEKENQFSISEVSFYKNKTQKDGTSKLIKLDVIYPQSISGSVTATSTLSPESAYGAYYVFDGSNTLGWVEGKKDVGIGEKLFFRFDEKMDIIGMEINTGFQSSQSHFEKNASVTQFKFVSDNARQVVDIKDVNNTQRVLFRDTMKGNNFSLEILKARRGSKWQDTVISEIVFLGKNHQRYIIFDKSIEQNKKNLIEKIKSSNLSKLIGNYYEAITASGSYEFSIRANKSFVIYHNISEDGYNNSVSGTEVLSGAWDIKSISPEKSIIKIFGKVNKVISVEEYGYQYSDYSYQKERYTLETRKQKNVYIFSDTITITNTSNGKFKLKSRRLNVITE